MKPAKNMGGVADASNLSSQEAVTELWISLGYSQALLPNKTTETSIQRNNRTKMRKSIHGNVSKEVWTFDFIDLKSSTLNLFKKVKITRKVYGDVSPLENYQYIFEIPVSAAGHIRD